MKYHITKERLDDVITRYLDSNWYPDYGWDSPKDYKEDWDKWKELLFHVNDDLIFTLDVIDNKVTLTLIPKFYDLMNDLFQDKWLNVFIKWFKKNTGLKFDTVYFYDKR